MDDGTISSIEDDIMFGGFWYVNFKNLESKNMDILEEHAYTTESAIKKRTGSM